MASVSDSKMASMLGDMLSSDNMCRKRAEADWGTIVHLPGIPGTLLRSVRETGGGPIASMAVVLLKNNITSFDRVEAVRELVGDDSGSPVLQLLLDCNDTQLAKLVAGLVVRIASLRDGPWEQLYRCLDTMIQRDPTTHDGTSQIVNALQTLSELAACLSSDVLDVYSALAPHILPVALNPKSASTSAAASPASSGTPTTRDPNVDFISTHAYSPNCQRLALRVLAEMCLVLGVGESCQSELARSCCGALQDVTSIGCLPLTEDAVVNGIPHEAMKLASVVANFAPTQLDVTMLQSLLAALAANSSQFTAIMEAAVDAELEASVIQVSSSRFDLLQKFCVASKRANQQVANQSAATLLNTEAACQQLFELVMQYSLININTAEEWVRDANAFLKAESEREDQVSSDTRDVAVEALMDAVKLFGGPYAGGVWALCQQRIESSSPDGSRWRETEAAVFIASQLLSRRMKIVRVAGPPTLNGISPLCEHLAFAVLNSADPNPCLLLRALAFLTTVVHACKKDIDVRPMVQQLVVPCAQTLSGASSASVVAASSRLLQRMVPTADRGTITDEITTATLGAIITACYIKGIPSELLYSLLELCLLWVRQLLKHRISPACVQDLPRSLMDVWRAHLDDPNVSELIVDTLLVLVQAYPNSHESFLTTSPWIASTLQGQESMAAVCAIPSLLTVLRRLLRVGDVSLLSSVGNTLLGPLCQLLLVNDDTGVLGPASLTLGTMLCRLGATVFSCSVDIPASHLHAPSDNSIPPLDEANVSVPFPVVVECIASKVLNPNRSELALMNTGGFLSTLVPVVSNAPSNYTSFMTALSQRCLTVRMDSSLQELLVPMCRMLIDNTAHSLETLNTSGTLLPVLERWLPLIPQMYGRVLMMRTTQALTAITGFLCTDGAEASGIPFTWRAGDFGSAKYKKGSSTITGLTLGTAIFLALAKLLDRALRQQKSPDFVSNPQHTFTGYEEDVYSGLQEDTLGGDGDDYSQSYDSDDEEAIESDYGTDEEEREEVAGSEGLRGELVECFGKVGSLMHSDIAQQVGRSGYLTPNELKRLQKYLS